jgi:hypothetical protein
MHTLAKYNIPTALLYFPRFVKEPQYLYHKIGFVLDSVSYDMFLKGFLKIYKPELVHDYLSNIKNLSTGVEILRGNPTA